MKPPRGSSVVSRALAALSRPALLSSTVVLLLGAAPVSLPGVSLPGGAVDRSPPATAGSMAPNWAAGESAKGGLLLTWLEPSRPGGELSAGTPRLRMARLEQGLWSEPITLASDPALFANWADFPSVANAGDGSVLAHWLSKNGAGTYAYSIEIARALRFDGIWRRLGRLNEDSTETEHGFVSLVPEGSGLRAFWLDGRATAKGGAMALRTAMVALGPIYGVVVDGEELDPKVCDCCQTAAAMTNDGPVVVYRDRSDGEVRDIMAITRRGGHWSAPTPVFADGWKIPGCPVNGPAVAARGRDLAVAWFSGVSPGAREGGGGPRVALAFSRTGGESFEPPVVLDSDAPLGRVAVVLDADGTALVSWLTQPGQSDAVAELRLQRVARDGRKSPSLTLASTAAGRSSGFPRLALENGSLFVAWSEVADDKTAARLRAAELPRGALPLPAR